MVPRRRGTTVVPRVSGATVNGPWRRTLIPLAILTAMSAFVVGPAAASPAPSSAQDQHRLAITTVSNPRPSLVSGGQVLRRVTAPHGARITENGHDITSAFHGQSDNSLLGLVTGLRAGGNE